MHKGVDLSHYNPAVDFGTLKRNGIEFVGLKATEGRSYTDITFSLRRERTHRVGFKHVPIYHFLHPEQEMEGQAEHFSKILLAQGALDPTEMIAVDVESTPGWIGVNAADSAKKVADFVYFTKQNLSLKASDFLLYGSLGWLRGQFGDHLASLVFMHGWFARYGVQELGDTSPWPKPLIWQNSERGKVPGVSGLVDTDIWLDEDNW